MSYLTVAPLVLVRVPGVGDDYRIDYHYAGSAIPWLSDEQAERFLDEGFVVQVGDNDGSAAAPADGVVKKPAKTAPEEKWVDFGVSQGHDRQELEALSKPELVDLLS